MKHLLQPIKTESLKEVFVNKFEHLILSGQLSIGQKLPPERELALQLGVSRPVVHEGLVELAAKGLVTLKPRVGTTINDYRRQGSLAILTSLINYHDGHLDPGLLDSLLEMRKLFEVETASLAARRRGPEHVVELSRIVEQEEQASGRTAEERTALDFEFHHQIAMASGNLLYPLILNSFQRVYTNLANRFFSDKTIWREVTRFHGELLEAIDKRDEVLAGRIMKQILEHGADLVKNMV